MLLIGQPVGLKWAILFVISCFHAVTSNMSGLMWTCRYLCKLSDQELRQSAARNMADLMWSTVKEPLDSALCFDRESLDLAFKYFMSPTLTMRLAGLSQITVRDTQTQELVFHCLQPVLSDLCLCFCRISCTPSMTSVITSPWCLTLRRECDESSGISSSVNLDVYWHLSFLSQVDSKGTRWLAH